MKDGRSRRESVTYRLPVVLLEFPFEVFAGAVALLIGATILLDLSSPASLVRLLPEAAVKAWAAGMILSGMACLAGVVRRYPLPHLMAAGLRLLGILFLCYGAAIVTVGGFQRGGTTALIYVLVGVLALFRAFHLRTIAEVRKRIVKES